MDFEERMNRLTERHEALAQSLELLAIDIREMRTAIQEFEATTGKAIENLLRIAEIQHARITRLEEGEA